MELTFVIACIHEVPTVPVELPKAELIDKVPMTLRTHTTVVSGIYGRVINVN